MSAKWKTLDTRTLVDLHGKCPFDGFVHLMPGNLASIHEITVSCWCDPKVSWMEKAGTILVSHRDKRPGRKGETLPRDGEEDQC